MAKIGVRRFHVLLQLIIIILILYNTISMDIYTTSDFTAEIKQKRLKPAEKSSSTSFWVRAVNDTHRGFY